jgi:serine/threonine protein kinase
VKRGDVIGGYVLTTDPCGGGGQSEWAFAEKDGGEYFIKRFLSPSYPLPGSPGSERTKTAKRARCEQFERHHRLIMAKLRSISGEGGNLVTTREFFRKDAFYYKVTIKIDVSSIRPKDMAAMSRDKRILIMLTAAKSLDTLHRAGLVHGDVKPENLLITSLPEGRFAVKVIDFDNCFVMHRPPVHDQLVGDPAYYSPELLRYVVGESMGDDLDDKNDVFALGLVFWQYLTGERPTLPDDINYAAEAVQKGTVLAMPSSVKDRSLADTIASMLAKVPADRPSMSEVHSTLRVARRSATGSAEMAAESSAPKSGYGARLAARLTSFSRRGGYTPEDAPPGDDSGRPPETPRSEDAPGDRTEPSEGRLRGRLLKRRNE